MTILGILQIFEADIRLRDESSCCYFLLRPMLTSLCLRYYALLCRLSCPYTRSTI